MEISARNQLKGTIKSVKLGNVMAEVVVEIGTGEEIVSGHYPWFCRKPGPQSRRSGRGDHQVYRSDYRQELIMYPPPALKI